MVQNMILKSIFYRQCNNIKHMMMSKSVEKCKKTNEGNTFHEKYTDPDDSQRFFEKV